MNDSSLISMVELPVQVSGSRLRNTKCLRNRFHLFLFLIFHSLVYCRQKFSAFQNLYPANVVASYRFKVEVKSVLRIGSAHKKGGPLKPCRISAFFGLFLN